MKNISRVDNIRRDFVITAKTLSDSTNRCSMIVWRHRLILDKYFCNWKNVLYWMRESRYTDAIGFSHSILINPHQLKFLLSYKIIFLMIWLAPVLEIHRNRRKYQQCRHYRWNFIPEYRGREKLPSASKINCRHFTIATSPVIPRSERTGHSNGYCALAAVFRQQWFRCSARGQ